MTRRGHVSTSATTYAAIHQRAERDGRSMSAIVEAMIDRYVPAPTPTRKAKVGEPAALPCTGCKRATVHRLRFAGAMSRWACTVCNRSKLVERKDLP